MTMKTEDELLKEVEVAVEKLAAVLERIQRSVNSANERFRAKICSIIGTATSSGLLDLDSSDEHMERVFDAWLDCQAGTFEKRYGRVGLRWESGRWIQHPVSRFLLEVIHHRSPLPH